MNFPIFCVECKAPVDEMATCSHYDDREARNIGRSEGVSHIVSVFHPI
jgi:hypothetical protein